ncbi:MAG: hypothetical protein KDK78_06625, partial [Chlamydiia bacterium]|nr:hypothetical protein [Chlamydiia bacterium]
MDLIRNSPEEAARCQLIAEEGRQRLADWEESRAESEAERSRLRSQLSENVCVDPRYKSKPGHLGGEETHDL